MQKVALISPLDRYISYGLRLVSSYLKLNNIETKLIFLPSYTETWKQLSGLSISSYNDKIIKQVCGIVKDCDLIGITMMTMDKNKVISLCSHLNKLQIPIILGGIHPTIYPDNAVNISGLINVGEGLESLVELCKNPQKSNIKNIYFRNGEGKVIKNEVRPAISDIDKIPFPDYELKNHYILFKNDIVKVDTKLQEKLIGPVYHQFATLGCPFSCTYCVNNTYKKIGLGYEKFRFHSIDYIVKEIKYALSVSSEIGYINFPDDGFIVMKEELIEEFAEKYKKEINLPFSVMGIIPNFVTKRKIDALVSAGLKRVRVGLQTANVDTLKLYKRAAGISKYYEVNDILQGYRDLVFPYYDIIVDNLLADTEKDLVDTIIFLLNLKGRFALFLFSLRFYPGTELYEKSLRLKFPRRYYEDSYFDYNNNLLNYILTVIRSIQNKAIARGLLKIYYRFGNIRIPKILFKINVLLFMFRCGIEHLRKRDMSVLPSFMRFFFRA